MRTKIINKGYVDRVCFKYVENMREIKRLEKDIILSSGSGSGIKSVQGSQVEYKVLSLMRSSRLGALRREVSAVDSAVAVLRRRSDSELAIEYFKLVYIRKEVNMTGAVMRLRSEGLSRYQAEKIVTQLHRVVAEKLGCLIVVD